MIVVGVDGSLGAKAALRWALAEARCRKTPLRVVHAWMIPYGATGYGVMPLIDERFAEELVQRAKSLVGDVLEETRAEAEAVDVEQVVEEGRPARVLLEQAEGAELLVVGSRGLGGFRGLLLGSVSQQCSHHANCPVVIVPSPHER